jgi:hypothetical protein
VKLELIQALYEGFLGPENYSSGYKFLLYEKCLARMVPIVTEPSHLSRFEKCDKAEYNPTPAI